MSGYKDILVALQSASQDDPSQPEPIRAFCYWIQNEKLQAGSVLETLADDAAKAEGAARRSAYVALLGYASNLDRRFSERFSAGVAWLRERQYFVPGRPTDFEVDGQRLLGVAVGLLSDQPDSEGRKWLSTLLEQSLEAISPSDDWNYALVVAAANLLGIRTRVGVAPDLLVALHTKSLLHASASDREAAWALALDVRGIPDGMSRAAARIVVVNFIARDAPAIRFDQSSVDDVARVLHGLPKSLSHWTWESQARTPKSAIARWDIENEYHVQNLLWAVLAPIFPDLDDEEWLKSLGQHHPRADLAIPSLRLVIEAKFLRRGGKSVFADVIQEIAADASTYLQDDSGYDSLIAVVWDDAARTEQHPELRQGLMALRGVKDVVILSRPSTMVRGPSRD